MLAQKASEFTQAFKQVAQRLGLAVLGALLLLAAFASLKVTGDGSEYVMMTHAFYRHATPDIRASDIAEVVAMPKEAAAESELPLGPLGMAPQKLTEPGSFYASLGRTRAWGIHALHFWMYSLLAVPFYALVATLGLNPALAFSALNCTILAITTGCLFRWLPRAGLAEAVFLALLGPVFYLRWTGPEVFSACCALLATLAMIRRDMALSVALAGFGATQNPGVVGLIPAAWAYWGLLALRPGWALWPKAQGTRTRTLLLAGAGIVLAVLPYAHNQLVFGVPSIIAAYFTDPGLISWGRFHSFFLDLNQGLVAGLPGLVLAAVMLPALLGKSFRFPWLAYAAAALCLTCGLSLSALAAVNWNNGYTVVLRYATWAAMPVTAVCIIGLGWLPARRRWAVLAGVAVCQVVTMWQALWFDGGNNLVHFRLATWVLDHAPGLYNPDPEIFFEREQQMEQELAKDRVIVHRSASGPTKVMRAWSNTANSGGVCPPGQKLVSPGASTADGWDYFNAPFDCRPGLQQGADWAFAGAGGEQEAMLTAGWSGLEPAGVWTEGTLSVLTVPLPQGSVFRRLDIEGEYFLPGKVSETDVTINGVHIGRVRLGTGPIAIPPAAANGASLRIELRHAHPVSPQSLSMSDDIRPLAFFLKRIYLDRGKAN